MQSIKENKDVYIEMLVYGVKIGKWELFDFH